MMGTMVYCEDVLSGVIGGHMRSEKAAKQQDEKRKKAMIPKLERRHIEMISSGGIFLDW